MSQKVAVIGIGYVGLPLALLARDKGYDVIGIDLDKSKVEKVEKGLSPIQDKSLETALKKAPLQASTDFSSVKTADIAIICVPTPVKNHREPDLEPLKGAVLSTAKNLRRETLLIIESTINPGVCDDILIPLVEEASGMKAGKDFYFAHCPERINPGDPNYSVRNINRVIGAQSDEGLKEAVKFYESIIEADIKPMATLKEAEAVKVVENSFRDINIAFVNELAMSFHKLGINIENVIDGAATKPFAFMPHRPGVGVGGHCIPVDPYYLIEYARGFGFEHDFLSLARRINSRMPEFTVELLQDALNQAGLPIKDTRIALLGLAYKSNVDDDRESPAYEVLSLLKDAGAKVITYDPFIPQNSNVDTLDEALKNSKAIVVATGHDEFKDIDIKELKSNGILVVIDGRNILRNLKPEMAKSGLIYSGIGV